MRRCVCVCEKGGDCEGKECITGIWLFGKTGVGKSTWVVENNPGLYKYEAGQGYWDGYQQETTVWIDEFNEQVKFTDLLKWTDRYECKVFPKYGYAQLQAERVLVTSDKPPWEFYSRKNETQMAQLARRFKVYEVSMPEVPGSEEAGVASFCGPHALIEWKGERKTPEVVWNRGNPDLPRRKSDFQCLQTDADQEW